MPEPPMVCFRRSKTLKDHLVRRNVKSVTMFIIGATFKSYVGGGAGGAVFLH